MRHHFLQPVRDGAARHAGARSLCLDGGARLRGADRILPPCRPRHPAADAGSGPGQARRLRLRRLSADGLFRAAVRTAASASPASATRLPGIFARSRRPPMAMPGSRRSGSSTGAAPPLELEMTHEPRPGSFPFRFRGHVRYALSDDGLSILLRVTSLRSPAHAGRARHPPLFPEAARHAAAASPRSASGRPMRPRRSRLGCQAADRGPRFRRRPRRLGDGRRPAL